MSNYSQTHIRKGINQWPPHFCKYMYMQFLLNRVYKPRQNNNLEFRRTTISINHCNKIKNANLATQFHSNASSINTDNSTPSITQAVLFSLLPCLLSRCHLTASQRKLTNQSRNVLEISLLNQLGGHCWTAFGQKLTSHLVRN